MNNSWDRIGLPVLVFLSLSVGLYFLVLLLNYITDTAQQLQFRQLIVALTIALVLFIIIVGLLQFAKSRQKSLWFQMEDPLYSLLAKLVFIVLFVCLCAVGLLEAFGPPQTSSTTTPSGTLALAGPLALLLTGALATVGWNYTVFETRRAERRRFTVETINKTIEDPMHKRLSIEVEMTPKEEVRRNLNLFESYCSLAERPIDPDEPNQYRACVHYFLSGEEPPWPQCISNKFRTARQHYAIGQYCDNLEWLALLIRQRRIDELLAREMMQDVIVDTTDKLQTYIRAAREKDPLHYEHIVWLVERWSGRPSNLHP